MVHFKATHEPFDYPQRYDTLYANVEIPEPASLYDFSPQTNGRSWAGQQLWILGQRYEQATQRMQSGQKPRYPGLPFSLDGLDSLQARKKTYQKFVKDFLRSGAAIDDNIGKLLAYLDRAGLVGNTVVIYTADQGYFLGEHGMAERVLQTRFFLRATAGQTGCTHPADHAGLGVLRPGSRAARRSQCLCRPSLC